jgi:hypothetical protein
VDLTNVIITYPLLPFRLLAVLDIDAELEIDMDMRSVFHRDARRRAVEASPADVRLHV